MCQMESLFETDPPRLPWPILRKALTMANGTLYNDCRLANSTVGQATKWLKEAFGLTEDTVPSCLDPRELVEV